MPPIESILYNRIFALVPQPDQSLSQIKRGAVNANYYGQGHSEHHTSKFIT